MKMTDITKWRQGYGATRLSYIAGMSIAILEKDLAVYSREMKMLVTKSFVQMCL